MNGSNDTLTRDNNYTLNGTAYGYIDTSRPSFVEEKVKENKDEVEIIGIRSARLLHFTDQKA